MAYTRKYVSRVVPGNVIFINLLLIAVAIVNSATLGYDASVMNGLQILPSYSEYFTLNTATTGLNQAASWMGSIVGAYSIQPLPDILGRKNAMLAANFILFVGIILQAASQNIAMFIIARFIIGFGNVLGNSAAPIYLAEMLAPKLRARLLGIFFTCYYVGSLLSAIINYGSENIPSTWAWRLPSLLQFVPSFAAISLLPFVPESPRWLISKGRDDEAREVLLVLRGKDDEDEIKADESLHEIKAVIATEAEEYPKNPWQELFSTRGNRKRFFILATFGITINMWGNFIVSFYLTDILDQAGVTSTTTQNQINVSLSCWSFVVALAGSFMLDILGRRVQTLIGAIGMSVSLFILAGLIKVYGTSDNNSGIYGTIAVIFLFQGFYAFSITPMTSLYPTEVAQYKLRAAGFAVYKFFEAGFGLVAAFTMSYAMADLSWKFYFVNGSWDLVFVAIIYFFYVETKGLKLEEIAVKFEGPAIWEAAHESASLPQKKTAEVDNQQENSFQGKNEQDSVQISAVSIS